MNEGLDNRSEIKNKISSTLNRPHISATTLEATAAEAENDLLRSNSPLLGIQKDEDGEFTIRTPALIDKANGNYVGVQNLHANNFWDARKIYIAQSEALENIDQENLLKVKIGNINYSFSGLDKFNPRAAVQDAPNKYSSEIIKFLQSFETDTFNNTIKTEGWEKKLFNFVKNYVNSSEQMQELMQRFNIKDLYFLSPEQAIEIVTTMVVDLTKYYEESEKTSQADQKSALELLGEGLKNKQNPDWQGNGVCRNFASITKALFDSIKSSQGKYSFLKNTHCVIRYGLRRDYDPAIAGHTYEHTSVGHVWNDFVQVSHDGLSSSTAIVDVTWAKRDLETQEIIGLDRSLIRVEKALREFAKEIPNNENGAIEINKIISYYDLLIRNPKEAPNARAHYVKALLTMLANRDINAQVNEKTLKLVFWVYLSGQVSVIEKGELETLYKLALSFINLGIDDELINQLIGIYLTQNKSKLLFDNRARQLVFSDATLQLKVNQKLKDIGKFDEIIKNDSYFRENLKRIAGVADET